MGREYENCRHCQDSVTMSQETSGPVGLKLLADFA